MASTVGQYLDHSADTLQQSCPDFFLVRNLLTEKKVPDNRHQYSHIIWMNVKPIYVHIMI
jgi:hypothetical protein